MAANPHDRRAAAETFLALLAVVVFVASAGLVHHGSAQSVLTLERRLDLLAEFEALRAAIDRAVDLDSDARGRELDRIRREIDALEPRWRACPPVAGSRPALVHRHGRVLLVLDADRSEPFPASPSGGGAPR